MSQWWHFQDQDSSLSAHMMVLSVIPVSENQTYRRCAYIHADKKKEINVKKHLELL